MNSMMVFLVAEDDSGHFALTKRCLRRGGFTNEILWFADGEELLGFLSGGGNGNGAVRKIGTEYVLLLDIRMPKVDGIEILERLKWGCEFAEMEIPIIVVTTSDAPVNVSRCMRLGCDGYVTKPLGENLIKAVMGVLSNCRHIV